MRIVPKAQYGRQLVAQSDNTRVAKPVIERKIEYKLKPGEFFFTNRNTGKKTLIKSKNETISADKRNTYQRKQDEKRIQQLHRQYEEGKKQEEGMKNLQGFLTFVSPSTYIGPVFNNNGKSYLDNVMSGEGTGDAAGNLAIDLLTPAAISGVKGLATNTARNFPFFIQTPNSYTRGLGIGNEGILDLVQTGIVRGNPRGSEVTAAYFAKAFRKNRNNFRDIIKDTGIKNIESKYFSRTLTESEFNSIKEAARKYKSNLFDIDNNTIKLRRNADPLSEYNTYNEYTNSINKQIEEVNKMPKRISRGEVEVDPTLVQDEDGYLRGIPIKERFGPNSDYVGDGTPLTYWYPDGRNAFRKGYDYAGSKWMVKVDNADKHQPFMHTLHLHPSFYKAIRLNDPDVSVYRRLPFGIGLKVPKSYLYTKFSK